MHVIYYIHAFDAYLLHVSVPVHHNQGEQLCNTLETSYYYDIVIYGLSSVAYIYVMNINMS